MAFPAALLALPSVIEGFRAGGTIVAQEAVGTAPPDEVSRFIARVERGRAGH